MLEVFDMQGNLVLRENYSLLIFSSDPPENRLEICYLLKASARQGT